jgi:hypothetical protein
MEEILRQLTTPSFWVLGIVLTIVGNLISKWTGKHVKNLKELDTVGKNYSSILTKSTDGLLLLMHVEKSAVILMAYYTVATCFMLIIALIMLMNLHGYWLLLEIINLLLCIYFIYNIIERAIVYESSSNALANKTLEIIRNGMKMEETANPSLKTDSR